MLTNISFLKNWCCRAFTTTVLRKTDDGEHKTTSIFLLFEKLMLTWTYVIYENATIFLLTSVLSKTNVKLAIIKPLFLVVTSLHACCLCHCPRECWLGSYFILMLSIVVVYLHNVICVPKPPISFLFLCDLLISYYKKHQLLVTN